MNFLKNINWKDLAITGAVVIVALVVYYKVIDPMMSKAQAKIKANQA